MSKKSYKAYIKFNLEREKRGLPTISRREFMRVISMASAGLSIPFLNSCEGDGRQTVGQDTGPPDQGNGNSGAWPDSATNGYAGQGGSGQYDSGGGATATGGSDGFGWAPYDAGQQTDSRIRDAGLPDTSIPPQTDTGTPPPPTDSTVPPSCPDCARVGIVRDGDILTAVRTAIDLAGGLSEIKGGDRVAIKPNITGYSDGIVTRPEVVRGIIHAVATHTDKSNITLVECTALGANTRVNATTSGHVALCEEEGINFMPFDEEGYSTFRDPKWQHILSDRSVPQSLNPMTFDHFINAPILKNHEMVPLADAEYTCCIKNFMGLLPFAGIGGRGDMHTMDLGEKVAELGCIVPTITMNVVDAIAAVVSGGPAPTSPSSFVDSRLILASKDRVACDSLAVAVLKLYALQNRTNKPYVNKSVWQQAQIRRGSELGLGIADPNRIEILDSGVDNIADIKAQWV